MVMQATLLCWTPFGVTESAKHSAGQDQKLLAFGDFSKYAVLPALLRIAQQQCSRRWRRRRKLRKAELSKPQRREGVGLPQRVGTKCC